MKAFFQVLLVLFLCVTAAVPVSAKDTKAVGEIFDLGEVLILEKGDEANPITSTNIVSVEDIEKQGAKSAADALELIPGLDVQMGGKGQVSLKIRGFEQRDVKVLIDGVPAHEAYFGSLDLDQIPADTIAKIKVIKGASSVLYGPNTMGGVVNIITKKGTEKPSTSITTSFGPNDTQNYIVNHGASVNKFNYWITASHRTTDGFELSDRFDPANPTTGLGSEFNEDGGVRDLSHYTYDTLNAKLGYEYDSNSKLYLSFDYHQNEKGCPTETNRYWEFDEWMQWQLNLSGEHDFTDILSMKARVYYVDHDDTLEDVSWDADHETKKKWFEKSEYDDYSIGGEVQAYLDFGDISLVRFGASYMKDNHIQRDFHDAETKGASTLGWQPSEEYETDIYSFGVEDEMRFFDRLTVTVGVSFDVMDPVSAHGGNFRSTERTWNPQAGISYDVMENVNFYASVGKKTRFPQMQELYSKHTASGNPDLKPQTTIAYEVGTKMKIGKFINLSAAAFFNDIEDKINRESKSKPYKNLGESEITGFELTVDITTPINLDIGLGYTRLSSKDREDSSSSWRESEQVPEDKLSLDLRYAFDFGLSAACQAVYTGDQVEHDDANDIPVDPFVLFNAKLNQEIRISERLTTDLFFEVSNLFDENYTEGYGPTPGRNFLVGMTVRF